MTPPDRRDAIEIDGRQFSYRSVGAGPPLLLLNGYSATAQDWDPTLLGTLASSFEVGTRSSRWSRGGSPIG